jgi:hypothetical protein
MGLAYRLKYHIERKLLQCAKRNNNFLVPTDQLATGQIQALALLDRGHIALVRVVDESDRSRCPGYKRVFPTVKL